MLYPVHASSLDHVLVKNCQGCSNIRRNDRAARTWTALLQLITRWFRRWNKQVYSALHCNSLQLIRTHLAQRIQPMMRTARRPAAFDTQIALRAPTSACCRVCSALFHSSRLARRCWTSQNGGRQEQAYQQGEEGWQEEGVSIRSRDISAHGPQCTEKSAWYASCRVDPFSKKDWYDVKAPSMFAVRNVGKTLVTRTQGTKVRGSIMGTYPEQQPGPACLRGAPLPAAVPCSSSGG